MIGSLLLILIVQHQIRNHEVVMAVDVKELRIRTVARWPPVRPAAFKQSARDLRLFIGFWDRLASPIEPGGPVLRSEFRAQQTLSGGAVEKEIVSIAAGLSQKLSRTAFETRVDQHDALVGI